MQNNDKSPLIAHHFNPSWNEQSYVLPSVKLSLLWLLNHRDLGDGAMHRVFHSNVRFEGFACYENIIIVENHHWKMNCMLIASG